MKKLLSILLVFAMAVSFAACGGTGSSTPASTGSTPASTPAGDSQPAAGGIPADQIKVGVIHLSDPAEGSGYTYTHDQGIVGMQAALGLADNQIVRKVKVDDTDAAAIETAITECIEEGCNIIFATSWGYMDTCEALAAEYLFKHASELEDKVYDVPAAIDDDVARVKLETLGIEIDTLTEEQIAYMNSWNF